ncbi:MAG: endonuclease/exonuclease/phosphatase family protein [Steroidobacteraceae bacterium]|nr:endonuclease/exonuclease/phosphatase family protein [Steroidobacteraceae bacterium]
MRRLACLALLALVALPAYAERLRLATWNLEWLVTPATFGNLAPQCTAPGARSGARDRALPCDALDAARRSDEDIARLARFAAQAAPDVVALQEVDGAAAAAGVFPGYAFCFTQRRNVQNVGFAIRHGIPHRCNADYRVLAPAGSGLRYGADVTLFPGSAGEIRLLGVHLKSGCASEPLTTPRESCALLQRQVPLLERWIDARAAEGVAFAVLGDFNRRFDRERKGALDDSGRLVAMWPELNDGDPPGAELVLAGGGPIACGTRYDGRAPIDHVVLGRELAPALVSGSYRAWPYPAEGRWPDHCLISVELHLEGRHGV